jgi:hypothetical protein
LERADPVGIERQKSPLEVHIRLKGIIKVGGKMLKVDLTDEDLELLDEALDDAIVVAEGVLEVHIDSDQTMETIEEFMEVVSTAQDHLAALKTLQQKLRG